jgi:hypothetical protein
LEQQSPAMLLHAQERPQVDQEQDPMVRRETLELVRAYYRIRDSAVRRRLADLVKVVAKGAE